MKNKFNIFALALSFVVMLWAKTASAVVGELQAGDLMTAPLMLSIKGPAQNIMITLDNAQSANNEVAWTRKEDAPRTVVNTPLLTYYISNLTPMGLSNGVIEPTISVGYDNNVITAIHRSHYTNPQYYNPEWTYDPWNKSVYNDYHPVFQPNRAPLNYLANSSIAVDLTQEYTYNTANWSGVSFTNISSASANGRWVALNGTAPSNLNNRFRLSTYFKYTGAQTSINTPQPLRENLTINDFSRVEITSSGSYPRGKQRTDCVASTSNCTGAEELQNFTNWFVYHRNRLDAQKGMASWALARLGEHYRVGLALTNKTATTVDGASHPNIVLGVRQFSGADRTAFFTALNNTTTRTAPYLNASHAPLRTAVHNVGEYFARDNPYTATGNGGALSECRRSANYTFTNGVYSAETAASLPYTATSWQWNGPTLTSPVNPQGGQPYYYAETGSNKSSRHANSTKGTLAYLTMTQAFLDFKPTIENRLLNYITTNYVGSYNPSANQNDDVPTGQTANFSSQSLVNNFIGTGVAGRVPVNYDRYKDFVPRFIIPSLNSPTPPLPAAPWIRELTGWMLAPVTSTSPSTTPLSTDLDYADDLQRAAFNGGGTYIYSQSRDNPNRLQPKVELLYSLAKNKFQWANDGTQAESTVLEEYSLQGLPSVTVYNPSVNELTKGSISSFEGTGYQEFDSNPANMSNGVAQTINVQSFLSYWNYNNIVDNNYRNFVVPIISSNSSPITTYAKLQKSNSGLSTNYSQITSFMKNYLGGDDYTATLDYLQGGRDNANRSFENTDDMGQYPFALKDREGPIFNSHPIVVRAQDFGYAYSLPSTAASYKTYLTFKKTHPPRLAVGKNDGIFSIFNATRLPITVAPQGQPTASYEEMAYVPAGVLSKVKQNMHPFAARLVKGVDIADPDFGFAYTVDGPASTGDIYDGTNWRSVVTGTLGNGGRGVFSIDVTPNTSLTTSSILWDKTIAGAWGADWSDIGHIRNRVGTFKMRNGEFATIFGNGAKSDSGKSVLFIVNALTGVVIKKITASTTANNGLMGLGYLFNEKREVVAIYGGDLQGNVWKFDTSAVGAGAWGLGNGGLPLFTARTASGEVQPITSKPVVYPHTDRTGNLVIFGTGANFRYKDPALIVQHSVYGVWDDPARASMTVPRSDLQVQTLSDTAGSVTPTRQLNTTVVGGQPLTTYNFRTLSNTSVDYDTKKGWYFNLPASSDGFEVNTREALTSDMKVVANRVIYATATPPSGATEQNRCYFDDAIVNTQGTFNPITGGRLEYTVYDTNGDGKIDGSDNALISSFSIKSLGTRLAGSNGVSAYGSGGANGSTGGAKAYSNAAGTLPFTVRSDSGFSSVREGNMTSRARKDALRSWRELTPR